MADNASLEKEMEALRADLAKLRGDLAGMAEAVKEAGKRKADSAKESLSHLAEALREELAGTLDVARDRGKKSVDAVEHTIAEKPFLSLLTAFGIGVVISQLLNRRCS